MAGNSSGVSFETIMKDLMARKYAPIYLLAGEEPYYIDVIADYIANNAISEAERDFNQMVFYGLDATPSQVMDASHAAPMMSEYQVVIVREAQMMKGIEHLEKYFKSPIKSTILVVCYKNKLTTTKKGWVSEAEKNGVLLITPETKEKNLPGFVTSYLKRRSVDIEPKAVGMMVEHIGTDLARMASELDKLVLSLGEKEKRITPEYVERIVGVSKDYNTYELTNAIVVKDVVKANLIAKYFDSNKDGSGVHTVVNTLFRFFQNLMVAYYCPNKNNETELAKFLGLRSSWAARNYITAMRNYNAVKTMSIVAKLRTTLAKAHGLDNRSISSGKLIQELLAFIFL